MRIPLRHWKGLAGLVVLASVLLAACGSGDSPAQDSRDDTGETGQSVQTQPAPTNTNTPVPPTPTQEPTSTTLPGEPTSTPRPTFTPTPTNTPTPVPTDTPIPPPPPTDTLEPEQAEPAEPENPAPEFGSIDGWYNGNPTTLAELRGQPVLLVFWADF